MLLCTGTEIALIVFISTLFCCNSLHHVTYTSAAQNDQILSLPRATPLRSNQFSGFLDITATKNIHYMYFESENNPNRDSVVFWTNGGPGKDFSFANLLQSDLLDVLIL